MMNPSTWPDWFVLQAYGTYSDEVWAASFIDPSDEIVDGFIEWLLNSELREPVEDYEHEMLARFRAKIGQPTVSMTAEEL